MERVKLGTGISVLPFRNPLVLARQVTTLDVLSGGRLILGVGVGWMREEFRAAGVPMRQRGARTDEALRLLRELWEKPKPSFQGRFTRFPETHFEPKPSKRRIPIWIGGHSAAALRRAARLGDGWLPMGSMSFEEMSEKIETIRRCAKEYGRSLDEITVTAFCPALDSKGKKSVGAVMRSLERYAGLGVSHFIPSFSYKTTEELMEKMRLFASEIIPSF